jgi:peptidoglycan/xylan/chitin deacetylase (PgdA/CDA1 family)
MGLKSLLLRPLTVGVVARTLRGIVRPVVPVFMMHRFASDDLGVDGHSGAALRHHLAYLRREGYDLVPLATLLDAAPSRGRPRVAFTVDDGYTDFADVAYPVFQEFDCPVTVFVATGVVDRACWYWYDRISYAFDHTRLTRLSVSLDDGTESFAWRSDLGASHARSALVERLKVVPEPARARALVEIVRALEVEVPPVPSRRYSALAWPDIRRLASSGLVTFGPHAVTHPPLPTVSADVSRREITESWRRLREAGAGCVPVFCFPFGMYGAREVESLSGSGMSGAVTTEFRYARPDAMAAGNGARRFTVPRISYDEERFQFLQVVTGVERLKLAARQGRGGWSGDGASPDGSGASTHLR